ncbi:MAG TPA: hypothetical protein VGA37_01555 [Gemmatimonadales bacterium]
MMIRMRRPAALAAGALASSPVLLDAVLVAPHALFISQRAPTGEVFLVNQGDAPEEVRVELRFGYPTTDSTGGMTIAFPEVTPEHPSAAAWLRAFPRRVRVEPGQRQLVRILARPPADLPDGEYWSRLVVTSRAAQPSALATSDSGVQAGITLELRTITSVTFRKGAVTTGVRLDDFRVSAENDSLVAWVAFGREGNAAYLGQVIFEVLDANERVALEWRTPIAVYYDLNRRFVLPVDSLPAGTYRVRLRLTTERDDIPMNNVLPAAPVERSVGVEIG